MLRLLRRGLPRGISPYVIADIFLRGVRRTHRTDKLVGPTALVAILPRAAVEMGRFTGAGDAFWGEDAQVAVGPAMFIEVPASRDRLERFWPMWDQAQIIAPDS